MAYAMSNLFGDYQALTGILGGEPMPKEIVSKTKLSISENQYIVNLAGTIDQGSCEIEKINNTIKMKIEGKNGPNAGKTYLAILEFTDEDEIRIAYDLSGGDYPSSFAPKHEKTNYVATFKRC